ASIRIPYLCKTLLQKMQKLHEMAVFSRVVATGSLSSAARELGLSPALVSRRIAALEARLGVRLLHRTTRSLRLTDEGARHLDTCSRKLAPNRRVVCASPAYLGRHGTPRTPQDLARHNCLTTRDFAMSWDYTGPDGEPGSVRVAGRYACDNWEVLREWALAGLGVALKSTWDVRRHLEDGSLVPLCPGYTFGTDVAIYAVYPHRRHLPAKTRAFIEFLADSFGPEPYWDRPGERSPKPRIKARAAV